MLNLVVRKVTARLLKVSMRTAINKIPMTSTLKRQECLTRRETREDYCTCLRMAVAISSPQFLPLWTIPVPALDGSDMLLIFVGPENWDAESIVRFE
jgi:hypothetical protein